MSLVADRGRRGLAKRDLDSLASRSNVGVKLQRDRDEGAKGARLGSASLVTGPFVSFNELLDRDGGDNQYFRKTTQQDRPQTAHRLRRNASRLSGSRPHHHPVCPPGPDRAAPRRSEWLEADRRYLCCGTNPRPDPLLAERFSRHHPVCPPGPEQAAPRRLGWLDADRRYFCCGRTQRPDPLSWLKTPRVTTPSALRGPSVPHLVDRMARSQPPLPLLRQDPTP